MAPFLALMPHGMRAGHIAGSPSRSSRAAGSPLRPRRRVPSADLPASLTCASADIPAARRAATRGIAISCAIAGQWKTPGPRGYLSFSSLPRRLRMTPLASSLEPHLLTPPLELGHLVGDAQPLQMMARELPGALPERQAREYTASCRQSFAQVHACMRTRVRPRATL
jgi:hypothetical protein